MNSYNPVLKQLAIGGDAGLKSLRSLLRVQNTVLSNKNLLGKLPTYC